MASWAQPIIQAARKPPPAPRRGCSLTPSLVGVTGIAGKIKTIIQKIRTKVDQAIDKLIKRVKAKYKPKDKAVGIRVPFQVRDKSHTQYIDKGEPMVASTPTGVLAKLEEWRPHLRECPPEVSKQAGSLIGKAVAIERKVDTLVTQAQASTAKGSALEAKQRELASALKETWEYMLTLPVVATGTMHGEQHTLTLDLDKNEVRLASIEANALTKVQAGITKVQGMDVPEETKAKAEKALRSILGELKTLEGLVGRAAAEIDAKGDVPQFKLKQQMAASAKTVMDSLKKYGDDFQVSDVDIDLPQFTADEDYRRLAELAGQPRLNKAIASWNKDVSKSTFSEGSKRIWESFNIDDGNGKVSEPAIAFLAQKLQSPPIQTKTAADQAVSGNSPFKAEFHQKAGDLVVDQAKAEGNKQATSDATKAEIDKTTYVPNASYGKIETPQGKPAPDPALRQAVAAAGGIVAFMKGMATTKQAGGMTLAELQQAWNLQPNVDYLKDEFRKADPGKHEWIPSNKIKDVIERASTIADAEQAAAWIELQHTLRTPTTHLIFKPSYRTTDVSGEKILSGHAGAVYYRSPKKPKTGSGKVPATPSLAGQDPWHNELRRIFDDSTTIRELLTEMEKFYKDTIWDGQDIDASLSRDVEYCNSTNTAVIELEDMGKQQATRYDEIETHFTGCRTALAAFLD